MKNRNWICYALDILGAIALLGAGIALMGALWFAAALPEPLLLIAFKYGLITAAGAFVAARVWELAHLVRTASPLAEENLNTPDPENVEQLQQRDHFPRAA